MTSSNGIIFRVTGPLCGEFIGHPSQRPVTRSFDAFFHLRLNERLRKQSRRWWFETPPRSSWRHCNESCGKDRGVLSRRTQHGMAYHIKIIAMILYSYSIFRSPLTYWGRDKMTAISQTTFWNANIIISLNTPKNFWRGCAAPVFDQIPLAKEILVENIPLAIRRISWSWAHFYMVLRNFSPNSPFLKKNRRKFSPKMPILRGFRQIYTLG